MEQELGERETPVMDSCYSFIDLTKYMHPDLGKDIYGYLTGASDRAGVKVVSKGKGVGSLEPEETAGLDYRVTSGGDIEKTAPHLWDLYNNPDLLALVSQLTGEECAVSRHVPSGTNINDVRTGGRYEMHLDSSPYVLLLFGSSHDKGGALQMKLNSGSWHSIQPHAGLGVLFDGSVTPHRVQTTPVRRLSVPMVFVPKGFDEINAREGGLDEHMYG